MKKNLENYEEEIKTLNDKHKNSQNKLKDVSTASSTLINENKDLSTKLQNEIENKKKIEKEIMTLKSNLLDKNNDNTKLSEEIDSLKNNNDDLKEKIKKIEAKNKNINNDFDAYKKSSTDEIKGLNKQIEDLNKKIKKLQNEKNDLTSQNDDEIEELKQTIKDNEERIKDLRSNNQNLNANNKALKEEKENFLKDIENLNSEITKLEKEKKSTQKAIIKKDDIISDYELQIKELKQENEQFEINQNSLKSDIKQLKDEIKKNTKIMSEMTIELEKTRNLLASKEKEISTSNETITEIKTELERTKEEYKKIKGELKRSKKDLDSNNNISNNNKKPIIEDNLKIIQDVLVSPKTHQVLKCVTYKDHSWYLFKVKEQTQNPNNSSDSTIEDYFWKPLLVKGEFDHFDNLPFSTSIEHQKEIESLQQDQLELIDKLAKKEREYNRLNLQTVKLINKQKIGDPGQERLQDVVDRLKEEIKYLQSALQEAKKNNVALSFINDEQDDFGDENNINEILAELSKNKNYSNTVNFCPKLNTKLIKNQFEKLFTEITISQNAKITLSNILKQLTLSEDEIHFLISKYRGPISLPK